jgi:hypothetical protein
MVSLTILCNIRTAIGFPIKYKELTASEQIAKARV